MMELHNKYMYVPYIGILACLSSILGYLENLIPITYFGIPGVKLGLANIVSIFALYTLGPLVSVLVMLIRVTIVGFMFGNGMSILYSLAGGFFSIAIMYLLKKTNMFSLIGVSLAGGAFHNVGQIIVATLMFNEINMLYYLPILVIIGTICGVLMGFLSHYVFIHLGIFDFISVK